MRQELEIKLMRFDVLAHCAMEDGQIERAAAIRQCCDEIRSDVLGEEHHED